MSTPALDKDEDGQALPLQIPTSDFYDAAGAAYEKAYGQNTGLIRALGRYMVRLPDGAAVLDLGSGTGRPVAAMLAARGLRVHGVDFAAAMVGQSRAAVPGATFEHADMCAWAPEPAGRRFAGLVAARSLFELTRAQTEALVGRWSAWLEPGAHVLLAMIGADDLPGARPEMYDADGRFARDVPFRFMGNDVLCHVFTKAGWVALLGNNGFVTKEVWTEIYRPPKAADSEDETDLFVIAQKPE